jgi:hypothetical protein
MRRIQLAGVAAAAVLSVTTIAAQTQTGTAGSSPAQANAAAEKVTVTGCLERADQMNSAGSNVGTSVDSLDFVLMKVAEGPAASSAGSAAAKSDPNPTGTSGASVAPLYRLQAEVGKLNPHVGHKVEVIGTREAAGTSAASGASAANPSSANAPQLRVESVKMIAESCGR